MRRWVPHFLPPTQKDVCVEAFPEMLRILHESEGNYFEGIAPGDDSWFQYTCIFSNRLSTLLPQASARFLATFNRPPAVVSAPSIRADSPQ
jgi:hypothetical protein